MEIEDVIQRLFSNEKPIYWQPLNVNKAKDFTLEDLRVAVNISCPLCARNGWISDVVTPIH